MNKTLLKILTTDECLFIYEMLQDNAPYHYILDKYNKIYPTKLNGLQVTGKQLVEAAEFILLNSQ
jgi:hypothetical protein